MLGELARTDSHRYRVLVPNSDQTKALRALSRAREDLVGTRVALANELRAQLQCFWPGAAGVFAEIDSPIALAFLKRYPTPAAARGLGEQRMAQFLARHSYSGRKSPRELLGRLHSAAQGRAEALETEARRQIVLALIAALEPIVAKIAELTSEIRGALAEHDDGATFRSLFKDPKSAITAATMLAEIGDCRERYPTKQALSADGGQSPVAVESGKSKRARFRWACTQTPKRDRHARGRQPPPQSLGRRHLPARDRSRRHPPTRDPDPRPRLVRRDLAPLARPHHLRPRPAHRAATPDRQHHHVTTVGDLRSPTSLPHSDGGRRRHRRLPAGQEREALDGKTDVATTLPRKTNFRSGLTQEV